MSAQVAQPLWSGPASPSWADAESLVMEGIYEGDAFAPKTIHLPEVPAAPEVPMLPMLDNLLPVFDMRAFGSEERVTAIRVTDTVRISCKAGRRPAGVLLSTTHRYPRGMMAELVLKATGSGTFGASLIAPGSDAPAPPQGLLGTAAQLRLPPNGAADIVLTCPGDGGELVLHSINIAPLPSASTARGTWVWDAAEAVRHPEAFARSLAARGMTEIALQAPRDPIHVPAVASALARNKIDMLLVEGDPGMTSSAGLEIAVARVKRIRSAFQRAGLPLPRLELDIEPYGAADYAGHPGAAWGRWAVAIKVLSDVWGSRVLVDVPWWMLQVPGGEAALERAQPVISTIVVMAYRTDPHAILAIAEPWLSRRTPVKIAVEVGPVAPEVQRIYRRATQGELVMIGDRAALFETSAPRPGADAVFHLVRETQSDPRRISFRGREEGLPTAERTVVPFLRSWPNYTGFRVHGLGEGAP
ncbi:hypothetical protein [Sphingomonas xinjiangensis]|uniref:Uncharacterized protein n=1 Tax=Sphingomonas xinjiangensis TaxID=643568 RepID=A0A840YQC4_9SPHN|nr:hypothetical protein [Sphingomonas xinjiangensis]MBB5711041.1 hypothetical protein [Sphingomonas xinjiangensis]